ncbi:MAG: ABC transporter permease [Armatimonadota bacterium]
MRWLREYVLDNPVYRREVRARWYRRLLRAVWVVSLAALALGIAVLVLLKHGAPAVVGQDVGFWTCTAAAIAGLLISLIAAPATAALMAREHGKGTFGSLAVTPVGSRQVVAGKMLAVALPWALLMAGWEVLLRSQQELYWSAARQAAGHPPPIHSLGEIALRMLWSWADLVPYLLFWSALGALLGTHLRTMPTAVGGAAAVAIVGTLGPSFATSLLISRVSPDVWFDTVWRWVLRYGGWAALLLAWCSFRLACRRLDRLRTAE